jgi:acetoin utilization protein AcuB
MTLNKPVSTIMSIEPVVVNASNKFSQVLRLFGEFPVHHLPIVDADNKLVGIVSSNDIYKVFIKLYHGKDKLALNMDSLDEAIRISDIMTPNPVTITSADTIAHAARIFAEKKFLSLPTVDNGNLIGILSVKDIIGYIAEQA